MMMFSEICKGLAAAVAIVLTLGSVQGCGDRRADAPGSPDAEEEMVVEERVDEASQPAAARARAGAPISEDGVFRVFDVYSDGDARGNHYVPSGWMGDYGDLKINERSTQSPHSGSSCIRVEYRNSASQGARWAGVYWQNPPNNWGTRPGGYDLSGATKLTFWARGEKGGERIDEFKIGGITGDYSDSDAAGIGPVELKKEWTAYSVDLAGKNLSSISGGFCWAANLDANPDGCVFYLDDIRYE